MSLWRDPSQPVSARVDALVAAMTLEEKLAQLIGIWVGAASDGGEVAPHQNDMIDDIDIDELLPNGIGQLTRPFGTAPVDPGLGSLSLQRTQERIVASNRFGIPAVAHEECLAGFAAWGATAYPVPLAWGASFDPELVREMAGRIGADMRSVGVHQGLAPVLDVVRDARWGRVEETIGEDPYLVATVATAYIQGLEQAGIVATLKHFVGYSASKAGRNLAPVSVGPRELADVLLPPFEMAIRESGVRSVMNSYTDIDGVPTAADASLLTGLLRDTWGFDGTVVADYFSVGFLAALHGIAAEGDWGAAAAAALTAGIDVELPTVRGYGAPLASEVRAGRVDEALVDRALRRVLAQKIELGLLEPSWSAVPPALRGAGSADTVSGAPGASASASASADAVADTVRGTVDLDSPANRALASRLAERAVVLLQNDGTLPLERPRRIAVVGPTADDPYAVLGCYSFPSHVGVQHPEVPIGISLPTLLGALDEEFPASRLTFARGTTIDGGETDGIEAAAAIARDADVVIVALGDRAGLFGRGTSGEGCDVESLALPGAQQQLLDAVLATGTPAIVVLMAGRPYALGAAVGDASPGSATGGAGSATASATTPASAPPAIPPAAAIIEAFFLGEAGTPAIAGVLSGRVNPAGRLPVSVPAASGAQPSTYLASTLARPSGVSNIDPTAAFPFGHGLSYSTIEWSDGGVSATSFSDTVDVTVRLRNTSGRAASEVVQLYLHDPVASVVRPQQRLISYARVDLDAGADAVVTFTVPADLASFTGVGGRRIVEPGELVLGVARSSADIVFSHSVELTGAVREVDHKRRLHAEVKIER